MNRPATLSALALAAALALTGCTAGQEPDSAAPDSASPGAPATTGPASGSAAEISDEHNDADVMFAQMMIPHHEQAVQMSEMLLAKDEAPAEVAGFAQRVIDAQGPEIEHMHTMLAAWDAEPLADAGAEDMHGMGHGSDAGMGGMMTAEDMQVLETAQGEDAGRLYLEQMTVHHEGAVEMARDQLENGQNPQALELARHVVADQEAEITEMERMLQELPDGS